MYRRSKRDEFHDTSNIDEKRGKEAWTVLCIDDMTIKHP